MENRYIYTDSTGKEFEFVPDFEIEASYSTGECIRQVVVYWLKTLFRIKK